MIDAVALALSIATVAAVSAGTALALLSVLNPAEPVKPEHDPPREYPEVTIVIPAYREGPNIRYVLRSLRDVEYPRDKLKVIVVGEEDDLWTYEEVRKHCEAVGGELDCGGIRGLYLVNLSGARGKPAALNYALGYVSSEVLAVYDAEDTIHPKHVLVAVKTLEDGSVAAVQFVRETASESGSVLEDIQRADFWLYYRVLLPYIMRKTWLPEICGSAFFTRLSYLRSVGGFNQSSPTEDLDLTYRFGARRWKVVLALPPSTTRPLVRVSSLVKQRARWIRGGILAIPLGLKALPRSAPLLLLTGLMPISSVTSTLALVSGFVMLLSGSLSPLVVYALLILVLACSIGALPLALLKRNGGPSVYRMVLVSAVYLVASWRAFFELFACPRSWTKSEHKG